MVRKMSNKVVCFIEMELEHTDYEHVDLLIYSYDLEQLASHAIIELQEEHMQYILREI